LKRLQNYSISDKLRRGFNRVRIAAGPYPPGLSSAANPGEEKTGGSYPAGQRLPGFLELSDVSPKQAFHDRFAFRA